MATSPCSSSGVSSSSSSGLGADAGLEIGTRSVEQTLVPLVSQGLEKSVRRSQSKGFNHLFQGKVKLKFNEFSLSETIEKGKMQRPLFRSIRTNRSSNCTG